MRYEKKTVKVRHDFADRLVAALLTEIQPEHFGGNQPLLMKGLAMEYIDASNILNKQISVKGKFYSFLSDDSDQVAATTAAHTELFLNVLLDPNRIEREQSTIMEDTDGYSKQYRFASSLYLISTICIKYGIVIDHAVGAPGHGKDVVDGLNAVDKRFLRRAMLRNSIPEEHTNIKTMSNHSTTPLGSASFAAECMHLS
eukprot:12126360-Ditylum_brightwellii.AAC.1